MEVIFVLIWFLIAVSFPLLLISFAYVAHVRGDNSTEIIAKLVMGFIVYLGLTIVTGFLAGMMVFIGAHTKPVGNALGTREELIGGIVLLIYAVAGWLMSSFLNGHLIGFGKNGPTNEYSE